jgi:hypothetical protein
MAPKKKTRKKLTKKSARPKKAAKKVSAKKPAAKKTASLKPKKIAPVKSPNARRRPGLPTTSGSRASALGGDITVDTAAVLPKGLGARSAGQSGDLQGLSNLETANSESVDELLEEGNAFEAEVVKGVEDAGDADESEVHTHETPEDPKDYKR